MLTIVPSAGGGTTPAGCRRRCWRSSTPLEGARHPQGVGADADARPLRWRNHDTRRGAGADADDRPLRWRGHDTRRDAGADAGARPLRWRGHDTLRVSKQMLTLVPSARRGHDTRRGTGADDAPRVGVGEETDDDDADASRKKETFDPWCERPPAARALPPHALRVEFGMERMRNRGGYKLAVAHLQCSRIVPNPLQARSVTSPDPRIGPGLPLGQHFGAKTSR